MADFGDKKILLTAFSVVDGSEGQSLYRYLKAHGATDISTLYWGGEEVASKIGDDVKKIEISSVNDFDIELTKGYDFVFRHTATRPDNIDSSANVLSSTKLFFDECPAPIIAVTGTKGKGTTSTLIHEMLEQAGLRTHLVGNIGQPPLDVLPDIDPEDVVVFEISSFQLWDLDKSPHIGVVLMIEPDHMDVHSSMEEYIEAKGNIAEHQSQSDVIYYHPNNDNSAKAAERGNGRKIKFMSSAAANIEDDFVTLKDKKICPVSEVGLVGAHNLENICAAVSAASEFTQDIDAIKQVVTNFKGLEHRLEFVKNIDGVDYYNDTFSTAPGATIAAIKSFNKPTVLILGGYEKNGDFTRAINELKSSSVEKVILIGEVKDRLAEQMTAAGFTRFVKFDGEMDGIVGRAAELSGQGGVVLLSPGTSSFDMFASYKERGKKFKQAVSEL